MENKIYLIVSTFKTISGMETFSVLSKEDLNNK